MLEYDRIDISEVIDINKTNVPNICHYWYFLDKNFKYELKFNGNLIYCHDLMEKAMNFNVTIVSVKGSDYRIYFCV